MSSTVAAPVLHKSLPFTPIPHVHSRDYNLREISPEKFAEYGIDPKWRSPDHSTFYEGNWKQFLFEDPAPKAPKDWQKLYLHPHHVAGFLKAFGQLSEHEVSDGDWDGETGYTMSFWRFSSDPSRNRQLAENARRVFPSGDLTYNKEAEQIGARTDESALLTTVHTLDRYKLLPNDRVRCTDINLYHLNRVGSDGVFLVIQTEVEFNRGVFAGMTDGDFFRINRAANIVLSDLRSRIHGEPTMTAWYGGVLRADFSGKGQINSESCLLRRGPYEQYLWAQQNLLPAFTMIFEMPEIMDAIRFKGRERYEPAIRRAVKRLDEYPTAVEALRVI